MVEMELKKIVIDENRHEQLVVLKEKKGPRVLPIVIGLNEIAAIKSKISGINPPRPITHDLLYSIIQELEAKVEKIVIEKLENNIFYAKIVFRTKSGETKVVDARPSDSIAICVRARAPIFVDESILKQMAAFNSDK